MNKQIQKLAEQAGMYVDLNGKPWPKWMGAEECETAYARFAELIVKECVEVVKWTPSMFPNDEYVKNIKEHFGVEE